MIDHLSLAKASEYCSSYNQGQGRQNNNRLEISWYNFTRDSIELLLKYGSVTAVSQTTWATRPELKIQIPWNHIYQKNFSIPTVQAYLLEVE